MIVIVDSGGANLVSIQSAIARLGHDVIVSSNIKNIERASHLILPGVGSAKHVMKHISDLGLIPVLKRIACPVLGICVGMQILYEFSEEGDTECLGIMQGSIKKLIAKDDLRLPHMGWNTIKIRSPAKLFSDINQNAYVYFVHHFYASLSNNTIAETCYGSPFSAAVAHRNFIGVQFHPERSGPVGSQLLKNFLEQAL